MSGAPHTGVVTKLLGVILMALGALDSMLAWRGGLAATDFYFALFLAGALLYVAGAIRGSGRKGDDDVEPACVAGDVPNVLDGATRCERMVDVAIARRFQCRVEIESLQAASSIDNSSADE